MFKCPECGSANITVEATTLVEYGEPSSPDDSGYVDHGDFETSPDGYAECRDCGHDGITEDFQKKG